MIRFVCVCMCMCACVYIMHVCVCIVCVCVCACACVCDVMCHYIQRKQWSITLEAAQRCFQSTAVVETSVRNLELWILRKGKPPRNQRVLQYIQDVKVSIYYGHLTGSCDPPVPTNFTHTV